MSFAGISELYEDNQKDIKNTSKKKVNPTKVVATIWSFFCLGIGLRIRGKVYYPLSKIKVYTDSGNSTTYGLITICDKKGEK